MPTEVANSDKSTSGSISGLTWQNVQVTCNAGYSGTSTATCGTSGSFSSVTCIADCSTSPTQTGYMIATGSSIHLSTRTVTCATGYSGTATSITCSDGTWSTSSGCMIVSCSAYPTQSGYTIAAGSATYGTTRTVICNSGYTGTASSIICQSDASWSSSSGCTLISNFCPSSPAQTGYAIASGTQSLGSTRTASCATGYSGTALSIACQSDASWSSSSGCTLISNFCPSSPVQTGYAIEPGTQSLGSTRTASCATGYSGTALSITCQSSGAWTSLSGCIIRDCGTPVASTGYVLGSGSTTFGSLFTMTCATGYSGTASSISCASTGVWSSPSGCIIVACPSIPTQSNYVIASGASTYGSIRSVSCATGYSGTASSITCQSSGVWTASAGCSIVDCGIPVASAGYAIGSGSTTYGATYSMSCSSGYSGTAASLSCQAYGSWTAQSGCNIISCIPSPTQTGYAIAAGTSTYGSSRTVSCASGYSGSSTAITCQASAAWTLSTGCTIVSCSSSPTQSGYTFTTGASTYGSSRSATCATAYSGSKFACFSKFE